MNLQEAALRGPWTAASCPLLPSRYTPVPQEASKQLWLVAWPPLHRDWEPPSSLPPQVASQTYVSGAGQVTSLPPARKGCLSSSPAKASLCQACSWSSGGDEGVGRGDGWGRSCGRGHTPHMGTRSPLHLSNSWARSLRPPTKCSLTRETESHFTWILFIKMV